MLENLTYNERLKNAGIKTNRLDLVYLEYKGKIIKRPAARRVVKVVKREFNLDI